MPVCRSTMRKDLRHLGVYIVGLATLACGAWLGAGWWLPTSRAALAPLQDVDWIVLPRVQGAFDLPAPDLARWTLRHQTRRHASGNGRQDIMTWGDPTAGPGATPRFGLVVYRPESEPHVPATALATMRQLADVAGFPVGDLAPATPLTTKFGRLPAAGLRLSGAAGEHTCLATGDMFATSGIAIAAIACNPGPEMVDPARLTCWLDRLTLLAAGGHAATAGFFARAEAHRIAACNDQAPHATSPSPRPGRSAMAQSLRLRGRI